MQKWTLQGGYHKSAVQEKEKQTKEKKENE